VGRKILGFDEDHGGGIGAARYHLGPLAAMTRKEGRFFDHSGPGSDRPGSFVGGVVISRSP
jgi:hypothetical protein